MIFFRNKNRNYVPRRERIKEYYAERRKQKLGIVLNAPISIAKNLPKNYASSVFGRPFKKIHISYIKIFILILILAVLFYLLILSPVFRIRRILVVNNKILIEGDIIKFLEERNIKNKNIFLLNTGQVKNVIKDYYKRVEDVRVYKVLPSKIKIKIQEKPSTVIWQVGDKHYLLDNSGFASTETTENLQMPIVVDLAALPVRVGDRVVTKNFIEFVNTVDESLKKRFGLGILGYSVTQTTFELKAHINSGFYILFDTTADAVEQLDKLGKIYQLGEIINEYVILSVNGRVIVK